jgi:hypothetical protein
MMKNAKIKNKYLFATDPRRRRQDKDKKDADRINRMDLNFCFFAKRPAKKQKIMSRFQREKTVRFLLTSDL